MREESQNREMSSEQEKRELDAKARQGETVVPGGTGGKSLEAQEHLAEGNLFNLCVRLCVWPLFQGLRTLGTWGSFMI